MISETITLILTNACNLNCTYCYEKHKAKKEIPIEEAKRILKHHLNDKKKKDIGVYIELFGGEPFLAFPLIKKIVDFLEVKKWKRNYIIFIDSNGTLITDEVEKWIRSHKNVSYGLSLDGTPEMHNINRCNSFNDINLDFYKEINPSGSVKMTISKATLPMLFEGVRFIHEQGLNLTANLAHGENWDEEDKPILENELKKLADFYIEHPEYEVCSIINFKLDGMISNPEGQSEQQQYCGAGNYMYTYDVDGLCYPCQFFTPLTLGDKAITSDVLNNTIKKKYPTFEIDTKCRLCYARNICPTCIGSNYFANQSIFIKNLSMCELFKIQFKATAYLYYQLWKNKRLTLDINEEYSLLTGIELVQKL